MKCSKCGSELTKDILMTDGPHYAKKICGDCGKFFKWIPNPDRDSVLHRFFEPDGGDYRCMFGKKHKGEWLAGIAEEDPQWLEWILTEDFPDEVHELITARAVTL